MTRRSVRIGIVVLVLTLVAGSVAMAQEQTTPSVKSLVSEIERQQNVQTIDQIDPNRVSDGQLAELGEAVIDQMVPNEREHAYMDQLMGGEGSQTLEAMHRAMGYNYLASGGEIPWGAMPFGPGMMRGYGPRAAGSGMMGYGSGYGYGRHMFGYYRPGLWWILPVLGILLVIAVVVLAVLLATRRRRLSGGSDGAEDALEILKRRYARGEISREDYDRMRRDL